MTNEIRTEFETYVKQLAETIAKEIYLEDLKQLCMQYTERLETCENLYKVHTEQDEQMLQQAQEIAGEINGLKTGLSDQLIKINAEIKRFQENSEKIFEKYSLQVTEVNEDAKKNFMLALSEVLQNEKTELSKMLSNVNSDLREALQGTITADNLDAFVKQMEESTIKITNGVAFLQEDYKTVFGQYAQEMKKAEEENWNTLQENIRKQVEKKLEDVSVQFDEMLLRQEKVIEDKVPDKHILEQVCAQVSDMCEKVETIQRGYEKKLNRLIKVLEKQERIRLQTAKENTRQRKYIYLLTVSNIFILFLSLLLVCTAKPWRAEILGVGITAFFVVAAILVCIVSVLCVYKRKSNKENK